MKKSKTLLLSFALALSLLSLSASAEEKSSLEATHELFEAMNLAVTFEETITKMVDVQIRQKPQIAPFRQVMLDFMRKHMGWESMKPDMARLYTDRFTTEEILELKSFYETPLGKKTVRLLPELTAEGAVLGQKRVQENIVELQQMIAEEAERLQKKSD
tara:strand:+ start:29 stop:505 length:477 start_codon:yes stop_codon:yes gene_type:complete